jgi:hypothetical protein
MIAAPVLVTPAAAQFFWDRGYFYERGPRIVPPAPVEDHELLTAGEIRQILREEGYRPLTRPRLSRGIWRVEALDRAGRRVRLSLNAWDGTIVGRTMLRVEREPAPPATRLAPPPSPRGEGRPAETRPAPAPVPPRPGAAVAPLVPERPADLPRLPGAPPSPPSADRPSPATPSPAPAAPPAATAQPPAIEPLDDDEEPPAAPAPSSPPTAAPAQPPAVPAPAPPSSGAAPRPSAPAPAFPAPRSGTGGERKDTAAAPRVVYPPPAPLDDPMAGRGLKSNAPWPPAQGLE